MKTILLFGTFDGVHEGHRACFLQAKKLADHLVVAIAPDNIVKALKGHAPRASVTERASVLQKEDLVDEVVVGDQELGSYEVLSMVKPDIIGLGYDQHELAEDVRSWARSRMPNLTIVRLEPFEPETYKSSKL